MLWIGISFAGCSALRTRGSKDLASESGKRINIEGIAEKNLSAADFALTKIEITIEDGERKEKYLGNIKYKKPGTFLISVRSNTGIEGMRIYINKDTVLANDRIRKKMYYGSSKQLYEKYGISPDYLPVLLGDLLIGKELLSKEATCNNGITQINTQTGQNMISYIIDCSYNKVKRAGLGSDSDKYRINMEFRNFREMNNSIYPAIIEINESYSQNKITLEIKNAIPYEGPELEFIPGRNYELMLLK